ncbi:SprT family zinc-dependent metalloprotease [Parabacteroides sp. PF5-9]|uniref:M48 family metallopeptidase n=1 Tax=Parabacteroides sp. PF5-9 TaxID=1742404 RepID=UPI002476172A|nr:SprT family zinc-dependent metalloprotease [Parabacteroides sp. PF5-9]
MNEKKWLDKELGVITLKISSRYKRYTLKIKNGAVTATMPVGGSEQTMHEFIEKNRLKLQTILQKAPVVRNLDETTTLQTATFRLSIQRGQQSKASITLHDGLLTVICPQHIRFEEERVQEWLREVLKNVFRREAKRVLPERLSRLAQQYRFSYSGVRINSSQTRWGSCSTRRSINLSLYLMQLPWHLIDYVLLHELCHTVEMNHSERFWQLMDQVTDGKAKQLRKELKAFTLI